jgi:hypothetical protein
MGLTFLCPTCGTHRICTFFANPLDEGSPAAEKHLWRREGEDFDTLTLSPSVHLLLEDGDGKKESHWHGFIQRGEVSTV